MQDVFVVMCDASVSGNKMHKKLSVRPKLA